MRYPTRRTHPKMKSGKGEFAFVVTREHMIGSRVADYENCAGACALKSLPGVKNAWVLRTRTIIENDDGTVIKWKNPKKLVNAVERFDNTAGLFPEGEYVLRENEKRNRVGVNHTRGDGSSSRPDLHRKRPVHALR